MSRLIWIVDDDESMAKVMEKSLSREGYDTQHFHDPEQVLAELKGSVPDLIVSDIRMPGMTGFSLLEQINELDQPVPVIMVTAFGDLDSAVDAFKYGAFDYLTKPFNLADLNTLVAKALAESNQSESVSELKPELTGKSEAMLELFRLMGRLSQIDSHVFIWGESGSGKSLVVESIHNHSQRAAMPLVWADISATPAEQLEAMLFGEQFAVEEDGTLSIRKGLVEQSDQGTLVLDEIGDLPEKVQSRLLMLLSDNRFYRVGGQAPVKVDLRIIATTNKSPMALNEAATLRADFFHRINKVSLTVPPLRERVADISSLIDAFLHQSAQRHGLPPKQCSASVAQFLEQYNWPGNVRELKNLIDQLTLMAPAARLHISDLPKHLRQNIEQAMDENWQTSLEKEVTRKLNEGEVGIARPLVETFEDVLIKAAMTHTGGHKINAAERLGWGRNTLTRKLKQLH